jgi:hypothetical protein
MKKMLVRLKQTILANKLLFTTGLSSEYNKRDKVNLFRNIQCQDKCKKKEEKEKWRTQKR